MFFDMFFLYNFLYLQITTNNFFDMDKESIFDYNPTDRELTRFGGIETAKILKERVNIMPDDDRYYMLALLFSGRGDKERFLHYCNLIQDKNMLYNFMEDF